MDLKCPTCHNPLELTGTHGHCHGCNKDYALRALCPECQQPLEVLKACGAVDYFFLLFHGLISKKRVVFVLQDA